ncbi:hypothetical protein ACSBR2_025788 [Camellia fascicularis]
MGNSGELKDTDEMWKRNCCETIHITILSSGKDEGCQEGLKKGLEVGKELGFFRGCTDVWNFTIQINPTCFSWRVQKSIKQMDEMVKNYPMWEEPTAQCLFLRLFEGKV